jgi:hypothetical protein
MGMGATKLLKSAHYQFGLSCAIDNDNNNNDNDNDND